MNPPPYQPPPESKNPIFRQILLASLVALPVAALIICGAVYAVNAQKKAAQSRAAWRDMASSANHAQSELKKSFDPKKGITNVDFTESDKLREKLKDASQKLSGDDAIFAKVGADYLSRIQTAATNYQTATEKLREAHVLAKFDSSDRQQLSERRKIVQEFIDANSALKKVIMSSEDRIRADLYDANIRQSKVDLYMQGFHSTAAPRNALVIKIRQCDERVGNATLDALNTLDKQWGHWKSDPKVDKIRFEDTSALETYNDDMAEINAAAADQLTFQKMLVNQPAIPQM